MWSTESRSRFLRTRLRGQVRSLAPKSRTRPSRNGSVTGPLPAAVQTTGISGSGNDLVEDSTFKAETSVYLQSAGTARRIDRHREKGFDLVSNNGAGEFTVEDVLWRPTDGKTERRASVVWTRLVEVSPASR